MSLVFGFNAPNTNFFVSFFCPHKGVGHFVPDIGIIKLSNLPFY